MVPWVRFLVLCSQVSCVHVARTRRKPCVPVLLLHTVPQLRSLRVRFLDRWSCGGLSCGLDPLLLCMQPAAQWLSADRQIPCVVRTTQCYGSRLSSKYSFWA